MDAAVDAMRSYDFSDGLIVSTIKGLLKVGFVLLLMFSMCSAFRGFMGNLSIQVYGEEGWPFIEESSYKVLFEAILEDLEKEEQENVNIF